MGDKTMSFQPYAARRRAADPVQSFVSTPEACLQRKCTCGNHTNGGGCTECVQRKGLLQRKASSDFEETEVPPIVHEVLRSSGQPINAATRAFMEPRFGHDFSQVRVHTDSKAAESARVLNALAYTVGRDIVFGAGQLTAESQAGKRLLVHELTHVVQQSAAAPALHLNIGMSDDHHEREANRSAESAFLNRPITGPTGAATPMIQRQTNLPPVPEFRLTPPSLLQPRQREWSLFPPGKEPPPRLNLLGHELTRQLLNLQGITNLLPRTPSLPLLLPVPPTSTAPGVSHQDVVDKFWETDFDLRVEEDSPLGQTLIRYGLPLQSPGVTAMERTQQIVAVLSGRDAEDTPLGLQLINTGINLLGALPPVSEARERLHRSLHVNSITIIANPATNTYGTTVEFIFH